MESVQNSTNEIRNKQANNQLKKQKSALKTLQKINLVDDMNVKDIATNTKETINYKFKQDTCKKAMKPLIGHIESEVDCEQDEDIK